MKKSSNKKASILFLAGILGIVTAQLLNHYMELTDIVLGLTNGVGIGLLLTSVMARRATAR